MGLPKKWSVLLYFGDFRVWKSPEADFLRDLNVGRHAMGMNHDRSRCGGEETKVQFSTTEHKSERENRQGKS